MRSTGGRADAHYASAMATARELEEHAKQLELEADAAIVSRADDSSSSSRPKRAQDTSVAAPTVVSPLWIKPAATHVPRVTKPASQLETGERLMHDDPRA